MTNPSKNAIESIAKRAGIVINDSSCPCSIVVHDNRFYRDVAMRGSLGLGESYMDGWWDCQDLHELFQRILRYQIDIGAFRAAWDISSLVRYLVLNMQSPRRSREVVTVHYDLPTSVFEAMLDRRMVYSCGYWKRAHTLELAQEQKLELICQKLRLGAKDRLLDIGCGWGSLLKFAYERYGCQGVGVTVSPVQGAYARRSCAGLPIDIHVCDYRDIRRNTFGEFTRVSSIGMLEHVGPRNYGTFMKTMRSVLTDDGLVLLQTIGDNRSEVFCDPWLNKYIFPNGVAPSVQQLGRSMEGIFAMEDWHNFGPDYARTLLAWRDQFRTRYREEIFVGKFSPTRFRRMWDFYLSSFSAAFSQRCLQLWQIVLSTGARYERFDAER
jgi:cyclopropane-fatty-acyl-phospholipid synthase